MTSRKQWLAMLAKLTSPMESTTAAQGFAAFLPMLADFPNEAFTPESLDHVASNCHRGAPNYADVRRHIGEWWKRNRPQTEALPALDPLPKLRTKAEAEWAARTSAKAQRDLEEIGRRNNAAFLTAHQAMKPKALHLTREQLNEAYRLAGVKGPNVPAPAAPLRAAAAAVPSETRKGPVIP